MGESKTCKVDNNQSIMTDADEDMAFLYNNLRRYAGRRSYASLLDETYEEEDWRLFGLMMRNPEASIAILGH